MHHRSGRGGGAGAQLQHPLDAGRPCGAGPGDPGLCPRCRLRPGGAALLPLAQGRRLAGPGDRPRLHHGRGPRRRPDDPHLAARPCGARRGHPAAARPRAAPARFRHRRAALRRRPPRHRPARTGPARHRPARHRPARHRPPASGRPASGDGDGNAVRLGVVSCHLSLAEAERYEQAGMLLDHLTALDVPYAIAAGDINDRPDGRAFRRIAGKLRDGWATEPWGSEATFSPKDPRRRIDGVFASEGIEIIGCGVPAGLPGVTDADLRAATDHLPVLAALRLPRVSPV
ncbi:endonuclease/exonuclease/phosphatase family protein [Streptomyces rapamycinicus]|uniref:endonuclease/exonuclease/phosphatase family protein n=1 Tax=Streptomyces rapamycinicus TaxID=1226757 RepID=UPI003D7C2803